MQFPATLTCLLLTAVAASGTQVSPVQKVIQLLDGMRDKGKEEMATEQKQHDEFTAFCEDNLRDKRRLIAEATEVIDKSTADIEKYEASILRLTTEIDNHNKDIESATKEKEDAIALRKEEAANFKDMDNDYDESVEAIAKALKVLKAQAYNRKQAATSTQSLLQESGSDLSLLQLTENSSPRESMQILASFLQQKQPEADGYTFQSSGVVNMLEDLKAKFLQEQQDLRLEEAKKVNAHSTTKIVLEGQIKAATASRDDKIGFKKSAAQKLATANGDLSEAQTSKAADSKYHKDLTAECAKKARDFRARQNLRGDELVAIQQASDIISGKSVLGASDKHTRLLQLQSSATALLSLSSPLRRPDLKKALDILQEAAAELQSSKLNMVVEQASSLMQQEPSGAVRTDASVITQIKNTMQQLLDKMNEQQQAEIKQKYYCDKEMGVNKLKRADNTEAVDSLDAEIDALSTSVTKLSEETAELSADITKIAGAMANATKLRLEEKATNKATVADAQDAQKAVTMALGVLQDFYEQAGKATALTQIESEDVSAEVQPQPYKGMQAAGGGVTGLLEAILEDFSRLEADTVASEESAAREYQEFMTDSKVDKADKETSLSNKQSTMESQNGTLAEKTTDLKLSEEKLAAANEEYATLKDECVGKSGASAAESAKRLAEIEDLKKALAALGGSL